MAITGGNEGILVPQHLSQFPILFLLLDILLLKLPILYFKVDEVLFKITIRVLTMFFLIKFLLQILGSWPCFRDNTNTIHILILIINGVQEFLIIHTKMKVMFNYITNTIDYCLCSFFILQIQSLISTLDVFSKSTFKPIRLSWL